MRRFGCVAGVVEALGVRVREAERVADLVGERAADQVAQHEDRARDLRPAIAAPGSRVPSASAGDGAGEVRRRDRRAAHVGAERIEDLVEHARRRPATGCANWPGCFEKPISERTNTPP